MVLWFYGYTASLGHDFMTFRAFPGFHNPMALWFCGSMVARPRSAPVLARTGFHDLLGILKPFLSTGPALGEFGRELCGFVGHHYGYLP